jgi:hypothetical protein
MAERVDNLVARLRKGIGKTLETLRSLSDEQWQTILYEEPCPWTVRDMLAHLLSTEEGLTRIAQNVAAGGPGAPQGFDYSIMTISTPRSRSGWRAFRQRSCYQIWRTPARRPSPG